MPGTTTRGYPYPTFGDLTDFPTQIQSLATSIDTDVESLWDRTAAGLNQPAAIVETNGVNQSVANLTDVTSTFDTEVYDNANMVNLGVSNTVINIVSTGLYLAVARVSFLANATGSRQARIVSSGALGVLTRRTIGAGSGGNISGLCDLFWAAAGTTVTLVMRQNSGGALNANVRQLAVTRLGGL